MMMEQEVPKQDTTHTKQSVLRKPHTEPADMPNIWRRIAFWSIFPAIIFAPLWFAFGRTTFDVSGWGLFYTLFGAIVFIFPYQLIVMILSLLGKKGYLSVGASVLVYVYYLLLIITQLSFVDGGDTLDSVKSVLTAAGVSEATNDVIGSVSWVGGLIVMVALIIVLIVDIIRNRHTKLIEDKAIPAQTNSTL
jgi:hypothetical protein